MVEEAEQIKDPLITINQFNGERSRWKNSRMRTTGVFGASSVGLGITYLIASPDEVKSLVAGLLGLETLGYVVPSTLRRWWARRGWTSEKVLQTAYDQLQEVGLPELAEAGDDLDQWARYSLAKQIRNTKLYLAEKGKLDRYQEFNWLQTIKIPEWLKPTEVELDEVDRYFAQRHANLNQFVDNQAGAKKVVVECGNEILAETTKVYLFKDPTKDPWDHRSFPLQDVMRGFAARDSDLQQVGIKNAFTLFSDPKAYEGIHSDKGKQRIADFFRKPVVFYEGAEYVHTTQERYGVKEPTVMTLNSLPEHLYRLLLHGSSVEPCSSLIEVEPTAAKLKKIGLVLART